MTNEQAKAQSDFDSASLALKAAKPNDRMAEQRYALAYRALVILGMVSMPLKRKYRSM